MIAPVLDRTFALHCSAGHRAGPLDWCCPVCGLPLEIADLPPFSADAIRAADWSIWRYEAMLPVRRHLTLGEGLTPLIRLRLPDGEVQAKLEQLNPTGSYKDRGVALLINHLLEYRVGAVVEDSSGNAGASLAAYARAAGIEAQIFGPESAPEGKKRLIRQFARLITVDGPRSAATEACLHAARTMVYASHAWSPFFIAGQMTAAWEIWEQRERALPAAIVCPVGQGGLLLGLARGFAALAEAGLIPGVPRLYAVQSAACDPVVRAWESGAGEVTPAGQGLTLADGIVVSRPVRAPEVLRAIRASGGMAIRVDDDAIRSAQQLLLDRGLLVEPTSAVVVAALPIVRAHVGSGADIMLMLTGSGLKTLDIR